MIVFLALAACLPRGLYVLLALIYYLFCNDRVSKAISGSTTPIFNKFSPCVRYLITDYQSNHLFPIVEGTLPCQPILDSKWPKSADSSLFIAFTFRNGSEYYHSDFKRFIFDDLATLRVNLVNFDPVTAEFKICKDVHPIFFLFLI